MLNTETRESIEDLAVFYEGRWLEVSYKLRYINGAFELSDLSAVPVTEKKRVR